MDAILCFFLPSLNFDPYVLEIGVVEFESEYILISCYTVVDLYQMM